MASRTASNDRARADVTDGAQSAGPERRVPRQARSKQRVEDILDAASRLVLERGVDDLSTRSIAEAASVPVASLYQYFADKEGVLLSLVERDMAEMDAQVLADLGETEPEDIGDLVETTMRAFTKVYARRPAFVEIWLRGRGNAAIRRRGREHNVGIAAMLQAYAAEAGLARDDVSPTVALLAVEIGDRVFQLAYEHDLAGDQEIVEEGIRMVTAYLREYAPSGAD